MKMFFVLLSADIGSPRGQLTPPPGRGHHPAPFIKCSLFTRLLLSAADRLHPRCSVVDGGGGECRTILQPAESNESLTSRKMQ
jgi:hypothetical protein